MPALRLLVLAAALCGCGGATAAIAPSASRGPGPASAGGEPDRVRALEARVDEQAAEVRELQGVVRIGEGRCALEEAEDEVDEPEVVEVDPAPRAGERPVLRLYGEARPAASIAGVSALPGPAAPSVVPPPPQAAGFGRLPAMPYDDVPAIPEQPLTIASSPPEPHDDPRVREYQAALAEVEARRWESALASLEQFARAHPDHPYADNAIYWQGEVLYARREYRRALVVLEGLVARYPGGNKVPDALLRIGFCLQRLGDPDRARATFRRVREQFPDTVAARMASREET